MANNVSPIMPLEYSFVTTSTPSTSNASRPKPHPAWIMLSGLRLASWPECAGFETTANVISADSPITMNAVTASVIGVDRRVRIFVHSERDRVRELRRPARRLLAQVSRRRDGLASWRGPACC